MEFLSWFTIVISAALLAAEVFSFRPVGQVVYRFPRRGLDVLQLGLGAAMGSLAVAMVVTDGLTLLSASQLVFASYLVVHHRGRPRMTERGVSDDFGTLISWQDIEQWSVRPDKSAVVFWVSRRGRTMPFTRTLPRGDLAEVGRVIEGRLGPPRPASLS